MDPATLTACALAALIRSRRLSPLEAVQASLARLWRGFFTDWPAC